MEEIYEKIMREGYGLQLRHGTRTRTGLVCRTDRGLCELKKPRGSTDSLRLAFDVKKAAQGKRLCEHQPLLPDTGGASRLSAGRDALYSGGCCRRGHWRRTAWRPFCRGGNLRRDACGGKGACKRGGTLGENRLPQLYAKRRSELAKVRRRNDKRGSYDAIDLLLLQYYEPYMERAAEAEELLCRGGYAEAIARTAQEGGCHNAYKGEALRQETDGRILWGISINVSQNCHWQTLRHISAAISRKRRGRRRGFLLCWSVTAGIAPFPREI